MSWSKITGKPNTFPPSSHTHAATQITGLTESRALGVNSSGQIAVASTTTTELNYVDGVTSSIQTQLNGKLSTTGNAASATYATSIKDQRASANYKIWVGPQASVPSTLASATIYFVF